MINKLPNPPLTEVIFELRWALGEGNPIPYDPGYSCLVDSFTAYAKRKKFTEVRDLQPPYSPVSLGISRRFHRPGSNFPLLQIGPGIFAANDGTEYEWSTFKAMSLEAAAAAIKEYRPVKDFPLNLQQFELRYLDTFDEKLLGTADLTTFINEATTARLSVPKLIQEAEVKKPLQGRIVLHRQIGVPLGATFTVDIASAMRDDTPVIRMETKVVSQGQSVPIARPSKSFETKLSQWLDEAHEVTSSTFKNLINEKVYSKFKGAP